VSYGAAAVLVPSGTVAAFWAWNGRRRYLMLASLPLLFGLQQWVEGMVWVAGSEGHAHHVERLSLVYMFFTWIVWPVWIPMSAYFIERGGRGTILLLFVIAGAMLGGLQFIPYFAHEGWLSTSFLPRAVRYEDINLLDAIVSREVTYGIYLAVIIVPFLLVRDWAVKVFGLLVGAVVVMTYLFFSYAYISVFCFGGALISTYLLVLLWRKRSNLALPLGA
jgi:hypothetical protein